MKSNWAIANPSIIILILLAVVMLLPGCFIFKPKCHTCPSFSKHNMQVLHPTFDYASADTLSLMR